MIVRILYMAFNAALGLGLFGFFLAFSGAFK